MALSLIPLIMALYLIFKAVCRGGAVKTRPWQPQSLGIIRNMNKNGNPNWTKGKSANPAGRPAAGMQSFKDRLAHWLETKTIGEIEAIVTNPKKWNKLLSVDAMVARRISQACKGDGGADFIAILDRLLGKPSQTSEINVTHGLADRLDRAEKILLEGKATPLPMLPLPTLEQSVQTAIEAEDV